MYHCYHSVWELKMSSTRKSARGTKRPVEEENNHQGKEQQTTEYSTLSVLLHEAKTRWYTFYSITMPQTTLPQRNKLLAKYLPLPDIFHQHRKVAEDRPTSVSRVMLVCKVFSLCPCKYVQWLSFGTGN